MCIKNHKDHTLYQVPPILRVLHIPEDMLASGIPQADLHPSSCKPRQLIGRLAIDTKTVLSSFLLSKLRNHPQRVFLKFLPRIL